MTLKDNHKLTYSLLDLETTRVILNAKLWQPHISSCHDATIPWKHGWVLYAGRKATFLKTQEQSLLTRADGDVRAIHCYSWVLTLMQVIWQPGRTAASVLFGYRNVCWKPLKPLCKASAATPSIPGIQIPVPGQKPL